MTTLYVIAAILAIGLTIYLFVALFYLDRCELRRIESALHDDVVRRGRVVTWRRATNATTTDRIPTRCSRR